ncbi:hypothetical protein AVEN_231237-1 [Araneus ventricosus]|uniref:Mos1 transposase HTH domain-containing protein n=1 Tax=Araneus ventricosus TaxID=182803 RepID=A0A4Y2IHT6_ARAVE|nr:hypothetical protein AVEN_231237-1 [Araneus ventricosus]
MSVTVPSVLPASVRNLQLRCRHVSMINRIDAPAKCELLSIIRFLQAEGNNAAEIHLRISRLYGGNFMSDGLVCEWCRKFKDGRSDVHDEEGQGRKSAAIDLVQRVPGSFWRINGTCSPDLATSDFHLFLQF